MRETEVVMGWTGYKAEGGETKEDALRKHLAGAVVLRGPVWASGGRSTDHAWIVASTPYAGFASAIIVAVLVEYQGGRFYVKDVDESMGPTATDCPEDWLLLVPCAEGPFADDWRQRVRQHWRLRREDAAARRSGDLVSSRLATDPEEARQAVIDAGGL